MRVWSAPTTDARLKKRIVRTIIHEVVADIDDAVAEIVLVVHWVGGVHSEIRLPKRRRGQRNSTSADVITADQDCFPRGLLREPLKERNRIAPVAINRYKTLLVMMFISCGAEGRQHSSPCGTR